MSPLGQILILAGGTYLLRVSFIAFAGRFAEISPRIETTLSMIPPAVLAAIALESLVYDGDAVRGLDEWHLALAVSVIVAYKTRSLALCIAVGMPALWLLAAV